MKIGILGYFGFGNYGDELFHQVWRERFVDHELITFKEVTGHDKCMHSEPADREKFINSIDALLIGGGDLIRPQGKINYWYKELLAKPVYLYGLGVATWLGKDQKVVDTIIEFLSHENVKLIGLRDIQSRNWLVKQAPQLESKLMVTPDIVFGMEKENVASKNEKPLVGIITRHQKKYEERRIKQMKKIADMYSQKGYEVVELLASTGPEKDWDIEGSKGWGIGVPVLTFDTDQEISEAIARCDVLFSMKFHGCVVGLLNHVPTVSLLKTDKFVNLYKYLRLENWLVGGDPEAIKYVDEKQSRDQLWRNIDTLMEFSKVGLDKLNLLMEKN